jgi:penicillin amidase
VNFVALAFGAVLGRRLAQYEGKFRVPSRRALSIRRDAHGVAYVDASDEADAWFGLGFAQAQDRAGQLEIVVRLVRGTLSEVIGPEALSVDRAVRTIGVRRAAQAQLETLDPEIRDQLATYVSGVNAGLESDATPRSLEHTLLRIAPSRWEPGDVIALGLLTCCFLPSNWDLELARLILLTRDGPDAVASLDPTWRPDHVLSSPPGQPAGAPSDAFVTRDLEALRRFTGSSGGSNAWAVTGAKAEAGRALLANDPHLPSNLPNFGYLARVKCPSFAVAGISIVGIPAFITGHNGHAAWGSTSAQVDNVDLFLEELSADGEQVREGEHFVPCAGHVEQIAVRGREQATLRVRTTRRGPIVAYAREPELSLFDPLPLTSSANAISFAATWLLKRPTRALLGFHKVKSFAEFKQACSASAGCGYSLVYADPSSIGWLLSTEVPVRKAGYGSLPLPGWHPEVGWEERIVGSAELPSAENPSTGFVCCANNKPVRDQDSAVFLGHDFLDGYRQARIASQLAARNDWTVERMAQLQLDLTSLPFRELRSALLSLVPSDPPARRALELLNAWNGELSADSVAASVYALFMAELCQRICRAKAPNSWEFAAGRGVMALMSGSNWNARRAGFVARLVVEQPEGYFDSWPDEMLRTLDFVMSDLRARFGADEGAWAWGKIRPFSLKHRLGDHKLLAKLFNVGPLEGYGDSTTVNQAGLEFWNPLRHSTVTAHLRAVYEIENLGASRFVILGGQSGNPYSSHYVDLVPFWKNGKGVPIHWDDAEVARHTQHTLRLAPSSDQRPARTEVL